MYGTGGGIAGGGGALVGVSMLPRTGFGSLLVVVIGMLLIVAGLLLVRASTVRRRA